jgi:hypothetical protein
LLSQMSDAEVKSLIKLLGRLTASVRNHRSFSKSDEASIAPSVRS